MNIIRLSATNPHITRWYSASFARLGFCGLTILIGVVPVGVVTGAGAVGATTTEATGAGAVGATTIGAGVATGTIVVTTGAVVVDTLGVVTGVADAIELLEPPPLETTGAEFSTGTVVLVGVILVVVFAFRMIFITSILFLRSENTVALTIVSGATVVALILRIACTNERDSLFAFADCTIALASITFCL